MFNFRFVLVVFAIALCFNGCFSEKSTAPGKFSVQVAGSLEKGFGYTVYADAKPIIIQTTIPAIQGLQNFTTYEEAKRIGELVVFKLSKNLNPAIKIRELDSLKVRYQKNNQL